MRILSLVLATLALVAACAPVEPARLGPDGRPLPKVYRIEPAQAGEVQYRMLDSVNALRQATGAQPLALNAQLTAAAATHARDMAVQNRPWHFGSNGSSPLDRGRRAGYPAMVLGENISETYETELETLSAWMQVAGTRGVVLDPNARDMGLAWHQEPSGKIWWVMVTGG